MTTNKVLVIIKTENGYIVNGPGGENPHVFEDRNEISLIRRICDFYGWKDVIDFDDLKEEKGTILSLISNSDISTAEKENDV